MRYFISGDGTGKTYGIWKGKMFNSSELAEAGLETLEAASARVKVLEHNDKKQARINKENNA